MLIHAHHLSSTRLLLEEEASPIFCEYYQLRQETWHEYDRTCLSHWTTDKDGLELGLDWSVLQHSALQSCTRFKTYEIVQDHTGSHDWVGIERVGYLLPDGFLPVRLVYRRAEITMCFVMPGNVGLLFNYVSNNTSKMICGGIAPRFKFALDVKTDHSLSVQQTIQYLMQKGPHLSFDVRFDIFACNAIYDFSQALDLHGLFRVNDTQNITDWLFRYLLIEPPVADTLLTRYPNGCIPIPVLQVNQIHGSMDLTIPAPTPIPRNFCHRLSGQVKQTLLHLQCTDHLIVFQYSQELGIVPISVCIQNRFGAYIQSDGAKEVQKIIGALTILMQYLPRNDPKNFNCIEFYKTCCDEVSILFKKDSIEVHCFYSDLNNVTDNWFGVSNIDSLLLTQVARVAH